MKYVLIFLFVFVYSLDSFSQTKADSIIKAFSKAKTSRDKMFTMEGLADDIYSRETNVWWQTSMDVLNHLRIKEQDSLADYLELWMANGLNNNGDYSGSLQMSSKILNDFRHRNDSLGVYSAYFVIADAYSFSKNHEGSIENLKKAIPFIPFKTREMGRWSIYNSIADAYAVGSVPDSGLVYAQKAMNLANALNDNQLLCITHMTTAENYLAKKQYDLALPFLRKATYYSKLYEEEFPLNYLYNDYAQLYVGTKQHDSAIYYAQKSLKEPNPIAWKDQLLRSYEYLYQSFEQSNQPDSTYKYYRLATTLKDSLFDMEKIKAIESISFQQQIKEQEEKLKFEKLEAERQHTIQFALLAIGIISFIIIFLLLSRSIITNTKIIKFLSIVALLMVFEFLNLILHPFLERITHHSPILMLSALVCIAALLVPLHHKIEHWAVHKLVEKNRQIRLAAAKRTIEQLETNIEN